MPSTSARKIIKREAHVFVDGPEQRVHMVLKSQNHGNGYINFDPASVCTSTMWQLAGILVTEFLDAMDEVSKPGSPHTQHNFDLRPIMVMTPPWGAFRLADYFTIQLQMVLCDYVDMVMVEKRDDGSFFIDREGHAEALNDALVIIIEDVSTKGTSTKAVIDLVEANGGTVVAVGSAWNRGGVNAAMIGQDENDVMFFSLVPELLPDWTREDCPLCAEQVAIATDLGKGAAFQEEHPDYPGGFTTLLS